MTIRDLSILGIFKIMLVVNLVPILILLPIFIIVFSTSPESKTWNSEFDVHAYKFLNIGTIILEGDYKINYAFGTIILLINFLVLTWFTAALVRLFAYFTPIGRIKISYPSNK